jgi:hypothetical protein
MERIHFRTLDQIWTNDISIWPHKGISSYPERSLRHRAIAEVLCSIPENDYEKLKEAFNQGYEWFIPSYFTKGLIQPFHATIYPKEREGTALQPSPYVPVIYLSPILERTEWDIVLAVVAREIVHIVLGHKLPMTEEDHPLEEAVFDHLCNWGFEQEAKKYEAMNKREQSVKLSLHAYP